MSFKLKLEYRKSDEETATRLRSRQVRDRKTREWVDRAESAITRELDRRAKSYGDVIRQGGWEYMLYTSMAVGGGFGCDFIEESSLNQHKTLYRTKAEALAAGRVAQATLNGKSK